jgi:hypothetical protein
MSWTHKTGVFSCVCVCVCESCNSKTLFFNGQNSGVESSNLATSATPWRESTPPALRRGGHLVWDLNCAGRFKSSRVRDRQLFDFLLKKWNFWVGLRPTFFLDNCHVMRKKRVSFSFERKGKIYPSNCVLMVKTFWRGLAISPLQTFMVFYLFFLFLGEGGGQIIRPLFHRSISNFSHSGSSFITRCMALRN